MVIDIILQIYRISVDVIVDNVVRLNCYVLYNYFIFMYYVDVAVYWLYQFRVLFDFWGVFEFGGGDF